MDGLPHSPAFSPQPFRVRMQIEEWLLGQVSRNFQPSQSMQMGKHDKPVSSSAVGGTWGGLQARLGEES